MIIRDKRSSWKEVYSGVSQGSALALIMFAVYINYMNEEVDSYMNLFAGDA